MGCGTSKGSPPGDPSTPQLETHRTAVAIKARTPAAGEAASVSPSASQRVLKIAADASNGFDADDTADGRESSPLPDETVKSPAQGPSSLQFLGPGAPRTSRDGGPTSATRPGSLPRLPSIGEPPKRLEEDIVAERMEQEAAEQRRSAAATPVEAFEDEFADSVRPVGEPSAGSIGAKLGDATPQKAVPGWLVATPESSPAPAPPPPATAPPLSVNNVLPPHLAASPSQQAPGSSPGNHSRAGSSAKDMHASNGGTGWPTRHSADSIGGMGAAVGDPGEPVGNELGDASTSFIDGLESHPLSPEHSERSASSSTGEPSPQKTATALREDDAPASIPTPVPADPWDRLRQTYSADQEVEAGSRPHAAAAPNGAEIVIDDGDEDDVYGDADKHAMANGSGPHMPAAKAGRWGQGEMAPAGKLMMGRGALDLSPESSADDLGLEVGPPVGGAAAHGRARERPHMLQESSMRDDDLDLEDVGDIDDEIAALENASLPADLAARVAKFEAEMNDD